MKRFAELYDALDSTTSTSARVAAMAAYLSTAPPADAAWALYLLSGRRIKRPVSSPLLREWAMALTGTPPWLFEEAYASVGDLAETVALLIDTNTPAGLHGEGAASGPAQPPPPGPAGRPLPQAGEVMNAHPDDLPLATWLELRLLPLRALPVEDQRRLVTQWWLELDRLQCFLVTKLMLGSFRVGVSHALVVRALAEVSSQPVEVIMHRLMGDWTPSEAFYQDLISSHGANADSVRPYPFYLASPIEPPIEALGARAEWLAEWKWDGIRAQIVRREGGVHIWSRGEDLITDRFPELRDAAQALPDGTVLDGEILAFRDGRPLPFALLQQRITRQKPGAKLLKDAPVVFMAFDVLEMDGEDLRGVFFRQRRAWLEEMLEAGRTGFQVSPEIDASSWETLGRVREEARGRGVEGIMLKRLESVYRSGRRRGDWWKWKIAPFTVDAVLLYAQAGHGKRANLFTDYTFAVWSGETLLPIAKAYSGLSDEEIARLDRWIRGHCLERFGPVRAVEPVQVFELAFEGIAASPRHKSGVAVRFPRILRWRTDKTAAQADTLETLRELLNAHS